MTTTGRRRTSLSGLLLLSLATTAAAADPQHGALLAGLGGCESCHTLEGGAPYAGGYEIVTPLGTFYGPNITPDTEHGIGSWNEEDFFRAMRRGKDDDGRQLYPSFPYPAYTGMSDADLADLWAYLRDVPASAEPSRPHDLERYRWRGSVAFWKLLYLDKGPLPSDTDRGRYLVEAVGHCQECHTPRNGLGALERGAWMAGGDDPEPGPNITPGAEGLGDWSPDDWDSFLDLGMLPDGDFVGGAMLHLVENGTSKLGAEDRAAIARWMMEGVAARPTAP